MARKEMNDPTIILKQRVDVYRWISTALDKITNMLNAGRSTLFLIDIEAKQLVAIVAQGVEEIEIRVNLGEGIAGKAASEGRIINVKEAYLEEKFISRVDQATGFTTKTMLAVPLFKRNSNNKVIGVIESLNKKGGDFTKDDEEIIRYFSIITGIVLENKINPKGITIKKNAEA